MLENDRTFRTADGEFVGHWSINLGQLTIKYGRDETSRLAFAHVFNPHHLATEIWQLSMDKNNNRIELSTPGNLPEVELIRLHRSEIHDRNRID